MKLQRHTIPHFKYFIFIFLLARFWNITDDMKVHNKKYDEIYFQGNNGYIVEKNSNKVLSVKYEKVIRIGQLVHLAARNTTIDVAQNWTKVKLEANGRWLIFLSGSRPLKFLTSKNGQPDMTIERMFKIYTFIKVSTFEKIQSQYLITSK